MNAFDSRSLRASVDPRRPIRLALAAPVRFYVEALEHLLSPATDIQIVGVLETLESALHVEDADLVLVDASFLPAEQLPPLVAKPTSLWLVVGIDSPEEILRWAAVGIVGYVPKHATLAALTSAIRRAAGGEAVCSRQMAAALFRRIAEMHRATKAADSRVNALTARERSVLQHLVEGHSNKRISSDLGISTSTVKSHVRSILRKLGVRTRAEAVAAWQAIGSTEDLPLPSSVLSQFVTQRQASPIEKEQRGLVPRRRKA